MIILPGHHSNAAPLITSDSDSDVELGSVAGQTSPNENFMQHENPSEYSARCKHPKKSIHSAGGAGSGTKEFKGVLVGPEEYDEYGAELGQDARFWKTYVREADRWDAELVDGWNKSLDVILIFAALFSAISTAFVIESSKKLQEDYTQTSAQTLAIISQTLATIYNSSQTIIPLSTRNISNEFTPSGSQICVNTLWYLSLSLSVTVSLVAMLAKEWCYSFLSGRTGHPCPQARRRQQRWDGLVRWKMPELLALLPSLIHLALLLFAVGLCIYLWDMHFGIAVPVIFITVAALGFYATCTILPLIYDFCPYGTTISRIYGYLFRRSGQPSNESSKQDVVTSQALYWLITNCEVPKSVDIALQAIAGASSSLPRDLLRKCDAEMLICRRLTSGSSYAGNYGAVIALYARALSFLRGDIRNPSNSNHVFTQGKLEVRLWEMQSRSERNVASQLGDGAFVPTEANLAALRIGSTAASSGLRMINHGLTRDLSMVETAVTLLSQHLCNNIPLHPAALLAVLNATGMFFSCGMARYNPATAVRSLIGLVEAHVQSEDLNAHRILFRHTGVTLAAFALSQHDYPGGVGPLPYSTVHRVERALKLLDRFDSPNAFLDPHAQSALVHFGLLHLLDYSEPYGLTDQDYLILAKAFNQILLYPENHLHILSLPPNRSRIRDRGLGGPLFGSWRPLARAWPAPGQEGSLGGEAMAVAYLHALKTSTAEFIGNCAPSDETYIFVLETACRAESKDTMATCLRLMSRFPFPVLTDNFMEVAIRQNLLRLLLKGWRSEDHIVEKFMRSQIWVFLALSARFHDTPRTELQERFIAPIFELDGVSNTTNDLASIERYIGEQFEISLAHGQETEGPNNMRNGEYFYRVFECILQERNCPASDPRSQLVVDKLFWTPAEIRGLPVQTPTDLHRRSS